MHPEGNHTERYTYAYDGVGRLVEERLAFDGGEPMALQKLDYDGIGRLSANNFGVFAERYGYNVRSTLVQRYSPVFQQTISFTNPFTTMYNGSIASITDELTGGLSSSNYYTYDNAGRMTSAMIFVGGTSRPTSYAYDLNSNITSLSRMGDSGIGYSAYIDQLAYQYTGNQLRKITDSAPTVYKESTMHFHDGADEDIEYTYDRNGNMTVDLNKGVAYQWDVNNRLTKAIFSGKSINFTRTATGRLLSRGQGLAPKSKASVFDPTNPIIGGGTPVNEVPVHHYYGAYEYTSDNFTRLNISTGFIDSLGQHVYVRDWQGNIRAVVRRAANGSPLLEQATYYYPYGMPMAESTNPATNRYKYTAKELLTENNLDLYDYGARMFDPETVHWNSVDEKSFDYGFASHYGMCIGDPINFVDLDGKDVYTFNQQGFLISQIEDTEKDLIQMQIGEGDDVSIIEGPTFEYGTIEHHWSFPGIEGKSNRIDIFKVRGDDNGKQMFEFLADNGSVEFSHFETGYAGNNGLNFITTSHNEGTDKSVDLIMNNQFQYGYYVRSWTHNHPSGYLGPSKEDLISRNSIYAYPPYKNIECYIYVTKDLDYTQNHRLNYSKQEKQNELYPVTRFLICPF